MKKLSKSVKTLIISSVSVICTLAIVLGCVFGLKSKNPNQPTVQGYELTSSQKTLLDTIKTNSLNTSVDNTNYIKDFDKSKYVDENGDAFDFEKITDFEDNYFLATDSVGLKVLYFYPAQSENNSKTLLTALQTQFPDEYNITSLEILKTKGDYICYTYKFGSGADYYKHYEVACVSNPEGIQIVEEYSVKLNYLGEINYLDKYQTCSVEFFDNFYVFLFLNEAGTEALLDVYTYAPLSSQTKKYSIECIMQNGATANFESASGFYIKNGNNVDAYALVNGEFKKVSFIEKTDINYYYNYIVTGSGLLIEENKKLEGSLENASSNVFLDESASAYVSCTYKFLSFKTGTLAGLNLGEGFVKAKFAEISNSDCFYAFVQKSDSNRKLEKTGKIIYFDGNLNQIVSYNASSIQDNIVGFSGTKFLTGKGVHSTKKTVAAELLLDFDSLGYELATGGNYDIFAIRKVGGIIVIDYDGNQVFDEKFTSIKEYNDGYFYAKQGGINHYILNAKKLNQSQKIENFSTELSGLIAQGYGLYLTETVSDSQKIYSFYDYKGNLIIENVKYSNFSLDYNNIYNFSTISIESENGNSKDFISPNAMLLSSGNKIQSPINDIESYSASLSGSEASDDYDLEEFADIDGVSTRYIEIMMKNGYYPSSGRIEFSKILATNGNGLSLVAPGEVYFSFTSSLDDLSQDALQTSIITSSNITTPSISSGIFVPDDYVTGISYIRFDIYDTPNEITSHSISSDCLYANFEFKYKSSSSSTSNDATESYFATELYTNGTFIFGNLNNVEGYKIESFSTESCGLFRTYMYENDGSSAYLLSGVDTTEYIYCETGGTDSIYGEPAATSAQRFTFEADYVPITYHLIYYLNGGETGANLPSTATYGTSFSVSHPTKEGYTFDGWQVNDNSGNMLYTQTFKTSFINLTTYDNSSVSFYAIWQVDSYSVKVFADGGTVNGSSYYTTSVKVDEVGSFPLPIRDGYKLDCYLVTGMSDGDNHYFGVNADQAASNTSSLVVTSTRYNNLGYLYRFYRNLYIGGDLTTIVNITACWDPITYLLSFDYGGGSLQSGDSNPSSVDYNEQFSVASPVRTGYTFDGWCVRDESGDTIYSQTYATSFINLTDNDGETIVFTAIWTQNRYNIQINYNDGVTSSETRTVYYNDNVTIANPTRKGYTFDGWTITNCLGGTKYNNKNTTFTRLQSTNTTVVFNATWDPIEYTVAVYETSGSLSYTKTVEYDSWFYIEQPTSLGYTFKGWYIDSLNDSSNDYIHYYGTGTSAGDYVTNYSNEHYTTTADMCWFKNLVPDNLNNYTYFTAEWEEITYSIAYEYNGGSVSSANPTSTTYYQQFSVISPTKTGYTFLGWTLSGLSDECGHVYMVSDGVTMNPYSFNSTNGYYYDPDKPTSLMVMNADLYLCLRCESGTVTFTAVWRANYVNITYHYLPANFDTSTKTATTINTISAMTSTKTDTILYEKTFVPFIATTSGAGDNQVPLPSNVSLSYWAFSTTENFSTYSADISGSSITAISGTRLYVPGTEIIYDFSDSATVHAYAVYEYPDVTLKFYIPSSLTDDSLRNNLANYVYSGSTYDVTTKFGSSYFVSTSFAAAIHGWMASVNHYIAGSMTLSSITSYTHNSTSYTLEEGNTVVWGIPNTGVYDPDNPVIYMYAVYDCVPEIEAPLTEASSEPLLGQVDKQAMKIVDSLVFVPQTNNFDD